MNIKNLIDEYYNWLKSETTFEKFGKYYEITLPFLEDSNDYIQIYVKNENNKFYLTDDGFTLANIEMRGINLT